MRMHNVIKRTKGGFTLIELLVVIAIIAILSVVVVLTLNPAEMLRQSRDSNRVSDLGTLRTAVSLSLVGGNYNLASSSLGYSACYLSTPSGTGTTTARCGIFTSAGFTSNSSGSAANYRKINSTGWVPVDFTQVAGGTPFGSLPIDPANNASYYYAYAANTAGLYELGALLESKKYTSGGNSLVTTSTIYETGSTLAL